MARGDLRGDHPDLIAQLSPLVMPIHQDARGPYDGSKVHGCVLPTDALRNEFQLSILPLALADRNLVRSAAPNNVILRLALRERRATVGLI